MPDGVAAVLSVLRSSAIVVGADDSVLKATAPAYAMGLVRAPPDLAELLDWSRRYAATARSARSSW